MNAYTIGLHAYHFCCGALVGFTLSSIFATFCVAWLASLLTVLVGLALIWSDTYQSGVTASYDLAVNVAARGVTAFRGLRARVA